MVYLCNRCGNIEEFSGYRSYTEYGTEEVFLDGTGEIQDWGDRDNTDSESGEIEEIRCSKCSSSDIEDSDYGDTELQILSKKIRAKFIRANPKHELAIKYGNLCNWKLILK